VDAGANGSGKGTWHYFSIMPNIKPMYNVSIRSFIGEKHTLVCILFTDSLLASIRVPIVILDKKYFQTQTQVPTHALWRHCSCQVAAQAKQSKIAKLNTTTTQCNTWRFIQSIAKAI
jgi:hypothetical protein